MSGELDTTAAKFELTGGMGSGKSTVGEIYERLGAKVFDTDMVARELQQPGGAALPPMVEILGAEILDDSGNLDRKKARELMFADPDLINSINEALHPMIWSATLEKVGELGATDIAIVEVPVPDPEQGKLMDGIISVITPREKATERLVSGRGFSLKEATECIDSQISNEQRITMSDFIIANEGDLAQLEVNTFESWEWIQTRVKD